MSRMVATYLVKVTLREPDEVPEGADPTSLEPPTIAVIEDRIAGHLNDNIGYLVASASAERTDI